MMAARLALAFAVLCGSVGDSMAQTPAIEADGNNVIVTVPSDASVMVKYVSSTGQTLRTESVATLSDLEVLRSQLTEWTQARIDDLNATKVSVGVAQAIQDQVRGAITAIGRVESVANMSGAIDQAQAACHNQGLLYNITSGECNRLVSCGGAVMATQESGGRTAASCRRHFYRDQCIATCPSGYSGATASMTCRLDGTWGPIGQVTACQQINECSGSHSCDQICVDTPGSYNCTCRSGFTLADNGFTCNQLELDDQEFLFNENSPDQAQAYTVPAGVQWISVRMWGSAGHTGQNFMGGRGAYVMAEVPVVPNARYSVFVGGPGAGVGVPSQNPVWGFQFHGLGGGLVGIFNTSVAHHPSAVIVAGSGGGAGTNRCTAGGDGGGFTFQDSMDGRTSVQDGSLDNCVGKGATSSQGGAGGGVVGAGPLGHPGNELAGGPYGAYGSGGGAGYYGGGGGGHCPNLCGGSGGGGSSFVVATARASQVIAGHGTANQPGRVIITPLAQ